MPDEDPSTQPLTLGDKLDALGVQRSLYATIAAAAKRLAEDELAVLNNALAMGTFPHPEHLYAKTAEDLRWTTNGQAHRATVEALKIAIPREVMRRIKSGEGELARIDREARP